MVQDNILKKQSQRKKYYRSFVLDGSAPFSIQDLNKNYSEIRSGNITDPLLQDHLDGMAWLHTRGPWYPKYSYLDIDSPEQGHIEKVLGQLGFKPGQVLPFTSPSWPDDGSVHYFFKPRYNDKPATIKLLHTIIDQHLKYLAELFPEKRKKSRLPLGAGQYPIDQETGQPLMMSWEKSLDLFSKLDPFDLESLNEQQAFNFKIDRVKTFTKQGEALGLLQDGLQAYGTRHEALKKLAGLFFRENVQPEQTKRSLMKWSREKHNGFSRTMNEGRTLENDRDIIQIVDWTYSNFSQGLFYPDMTNNSEGGITRQDLDMIAEVFPGDVVNMKRLFNLLLYYRPRSIFPWVFIPWIRWKEIANVRHYKTFQGELLKRGILESMDTYRPGQFSKRYRIPGIRPGDPIQDDGRNVQDWAEILNQLETDYLKNKLGLSARTIFNIRKG